MPAQTEIFDPPRWPGGPHICVYENLPALPSCKELNQFLDANAPGIIILAQWKCKRCGEWHNKTGGLSR
jgi:hypothetical protein